MTVFIVGWGSHQWYRTAFKPKGTAARSAGSTPLEMTNLFLDNPVDGSSAGRRGRARSAAVVGLNLWFPRSFLDHNFIDSSMKVL